MKQRFSKSPFGRQLLAIRGRWESEIAACRVIEEQAQIVVLSASAGAAVALGSYGALLLSELYSEEAAFVPQGDGPPDPVVQFAYSLQSESSMEAAYRVATWGVTGELADFFWSPNYGEQIQECARAFTFQNDYEVRTAALAEPAEQVIAGQPERRATLEKGTLIFMIGAASGAAVPWDDPFVTKNMPVWQRQFREGLSVATKRMRQLAPHGLPRQVAKL